MKRIMLAFFLILSLHASLSAAQFPKKVTLLVTRSEDDMFFKLVVDFAKAAANNLGLSLQVLYANSDPGKMIINAHKAIESKSDAITFMNFMETAPDVIKLAEMHRTPVLLFNADVSPEANMGKPREKYQHWVGKIMPDDNGAGYQLAKLLIQAAPTDEKGRVHIAAIEGEHTVSASIERITGLKRALKEHPETTLHGLSAANWEPKKAEEQFLALKEKYPYVQTVWAASDGMGLGILNGAKKLGLTPRYGILTGGVDWSKEGIQKVKSGEFVTSVGGHFMEGAWVMVLLYDYLHGKDFADESVTLNSPMVSLTQKNLPLLQKVLDQNNWDKIDFKQFSKIHNPKLKRYDFNIGSLLW